MYVFHGSFSFLQLIVFIIISYCLPCILVNKDYYSLKGHSPSSSGATKFIFTYLLSYKNLHIIRRNTRWYIYLHVVDMFQTSFSGDAWQRLVIVESR